MKKNLLVFASLLLLFSCSDEKLSSAGGESVNGEDLTERSSYNVTYDDAVHMALNAPNLFKTAQTKAGEKTVGECLPILSGPATKSGSTDTLVYLINYANGQGYTFIPKDGRKGNYLAYVDNGSFNVADTATNDLIKYLYKTIVGYCKSEVIATKGSGATYDGEYSSYTGKDFYAKTGAGCSKVRPAYMYTQGSVNIGTPPNVDYYQTQGCVAKLSAEWFMEDNGVDPLLTTSWGQGYPFNEKAPLINGQRAIAGCVATAVTQVIAYHSFPLTYPQGTVIDGSDYSGKVTKLDVLKRYRYASYENNGNGPGFRDYVSQMYRYAGDQLRNSWGVSSTGAVTANSPSCFKSLGYSSAPSIINYDALALTNSLNNGWPVIIRGSDDNGGGGHAWVIDGYRYLVLGYSKFYFNENGTLYYKSEMTPNASAPLLYVNCNFGWNGLANGFYYNNLFDTNEGPLVETKYNFVGTQIIVNIHP